MRSIKEFKHGRDMINLVHGKCIGCWKDAIVEKNEGIDLINSKVSITIDTQKPLKFDTRFS